MKRPRGFDKMVDEVVMHAENDPELQEGIDFIDKKATERGISFYDMMYMVMIESPNSDEIRRQLNGKQD